MNQTIYTGGLPASLPSTLVLVVFGLLILVVLVLVVRRQGAISAASGGWVDASTRIAVSLHFGA